jgi:hypothetical protein
VRVQSFQIKYTLGADIVYDHYAIPVIRTTLTRNIGNCFDDMEDEIAAAFTDHMPATEGEKPPQFSRVPNHSYLLLDWSKVLVLPSIIEITFRTSNRVFVGLPIC